MTDQTNDAADNDVAETPDELKMLKARADQIGVKYSNNIKLDTLRARVNAKLEGEEDPTADDEDENDDENGDEDEQANKAMLVKASDDKTDKVVEPTEAEIAKMPKTQRDAYLRHKLTQDAMRLVRIRVACLDPKKKEVPGEIFTTGNRFIGTVKKYVPFGEGTENGFHVPHCIYEMMKSRKFLQISNPKRDARTGVNSTKTRYVPEFAIEVLPPLTEAELAKLAVEQQASGRLGNED